MFEKNDKVIVEGQELIVSKTEGNSVYAFARGGSIEYKVSAEKCHKVKNFSDKELEGFAYFEDSPMYPAVCNPKDRWNGWAKPKFIREVILEILKANDYIILTEDDASIKYVDKNADDEEEPQYILKSTDNLYSFDGWCWDFDKK